MECAGNGNGNDGSPPPFLSKTYDMVDDQSTDSVVSWSHSGKSFVVWNPPEFARLLLPKYFKHKNFSSFVRQLNTYGFRKVDPDRWEFANEGFLRGQKHMLKAISRRKPTHSHTSRQPTQGQGVPLGACVEVGNFGGLDEELECLKRDKNVLMQEVVRLRQQQQATDHQVLNLIQRIQGMENKQQNMMSFLAKAMQSPAFLTQFVQQNEGGGQIEGDGGNHGVRGVNGPRRMVTVKKKRRIPRDEVDMERQDEQMMPEDNQMIKYRPPRGSRKSILMQMLHTNSSHFPSSPDHNFPVDSVPLPANDPENGCPSRQNSCLTSAEMNQTTGLDYIRAPTAGFRDVSASAVVSGMQSPSSTPEMVGNQMHHLPDANLEFSPLHTVPGLPCMSPPAVPNTNNAGVNLVNGAKYGASKVGVDYINHIAADASIPLEPEQFSCAADTDDFFEGMPMLLPDMSEFSWGRLPSGASTSDDVDDVQSSTHDSLSNETVFNPAAIRESEWDTASMDQLTQQMGFLASTLNC